MGNRKYRVNAAVAGDCAKAVVQFTHEVVAAEVRMNHTTADFSHICRVYVKAKLFGLFSKFMLIKEKGTCPDKIIIVVKCT